MNRNEQEEFWAGEFGDVYSDRNTDEWRLKGCIEFFEEILSLTEKGAVKSICEYGANTGNNLLALRMISSDFKLYGVEINKKSFNILKARNVGFEKAVNSSILECGFKDNSFDLTFTSGVLIHINPDALIENVKKIVSTSNRYILVNEYFSHSPVEVEYRGHSGKLFKRDFGSFYLDHFPELKVVSHGFIWMRLNPSFDNMNWWLFEK
jgi:spore coat polysaccharide biosynthesis protein SpsF